MRNTTPAPPNQCTRCYVCTLWSDRPPKVYHLEEGAVPLIIGTHELHILEDDLEKTAESLRAKLGLFERGEETCATGLIRLPCSSPRGPASGVRRDGGDREQDEPWGYDEYSFSSASSTAPTRDGDGDSYKSRWQQRSSKDNHGADAGDHDASYSVAGYEGDDKSGVRTYLRSFKQAAPPPPSPPAAHDATADADAAIYEEYVYFSSTAGGERERYFRDRDGDDDNILSASATEPAIVGPGAAHELDYDEYVAEVEGHSDGSSGVGDEDDGYYRAMLMRLSEDSRAASAAAAHAAYAAHAAHAHASAVVAGASSTADLAAG